jgi:hypothetical protein
MLADHSISLPAKVQHGVRTGLELRHDVDGENCPRPGRHDRWMHVELALNISVRSSGVA